MVTVNLLLAPNPFDSSLGFLMGWLLVRFIVTGLLSHGLGCPDAVLTPMSWYIRTSHNCSLRALAHTLPTTERASM
jgi:hypothetical protein